MRKIGINFMCKSGFERQEYIDKIKAMGIDATFTGVYNEEDSFDIANKLSAAGIEWETMHASFAYINDMWRDASHSWEAYKNLTDAVDRCASVGVKKTVIHMTSGLTPPPVSDLGCARYEKLVNYAISKGVTLAFENIRKISHMAWAFEKFADVPEVGFCWDVGHEGCYYPPCTQFMNMFEDKLICTHIHDNDKVYNRDDHYLPFDGKIDFDRVAKQLKNFDGILMLEVSGNIERYAEMDKDEYLEKAVGTIKRLREMVEAE